MGLGFDCGFGNQFDVRYLCKSKHYPCPELNVTHAVDARELWAALELSDKFSDWIKRQLNISSSMPAFFTQGIDYVDFEVKLKNPNNPIGGRPRTEYALTLDTAKHIALMSRTAKG